MQEIKLTINGTREIPIDVSEELLNKLKNPNKDVQFVVTASLTETGNRPSHGEEPPTELIKFKLLALDIK